MAFKSVGPSLVKKPTQSILKTEKQILNNRKNTMDTNIF